MLSVIFGEMSLQMESFGILESFCLLMLVLKHMDSLQVS